ncbi:MAG: NAD(P)/FAD-dependent oxidoreductase [Acidimicrobiales bacterium]
MADAVGTEVLIVGAGMTGLTAALALAEAGKRVLVVDKGRGVGGRLATRRIGTAVLDHGAQFFTVRSKAFADAVSMWETDGIVSVWANGFDPDQTDGHPRFRTEGGMSQLAKHLAAACIRAGAEVVLNQRVDAIIDTGDGITATYEGGSRLPDEAAAALLTAPVPQAVELLRAGGAPVPDDALLMTYSPVIAVLMTTDDDAGEVVGPLGARQQPLDPMFTFIADNQRKGISPQTALTFHVESALSAALWDLGHDEILHRLQPEFDRVLGSVKPVQIQVKKWRYATPRSSHDDLFLPIGGTSVPVVLAGDGFGEAKVEGAFLSGRAVAERILRLI